MRNAIEADINGRLVRIPPGSNAAAALLNAGESRFRTSVSGAPRGPLCAMGTCFECRATIDGVEQTRACLESRGGSSDVPDAAYDIAVVGGGPAGIAAAVRASTPGKRVVVFDSSAGPGGQIWRNRSQASLPRRALEWIQALDSCGAAVIRRAEVVTAEKSGAGFDLTVQTPGSACRVRAGRLILATGARERFLPFPGWTLPNVFGVGGAQALAKSGASFEGKRIVLAGSGPLLLPAAATLARCGAKIALVAEQAPAARIVGFAAGLWRAPALLAQAARYRAAFRGARYAAGTWVVEARGDDRVSEVMLTDGRRRWAERCDVLATGFGLVPNTEIARLLGCRIGAEGVSVDEAQRTSAENVYCAGEPTGIGGVESAILEGEIAGLCAAGNEDAARSRFPGRDRSRRYARRLERAFRLRSELRQIATHETIVCRCEDVAFGAFQASWSQRQAKLYTRAGMGPCQGRVCGPALAFHFGWETDTVRVPVLPASIESMLAAFEGVEREGP
ncbi:MAG: FAD-dependent oxidoreductase [Thermoanaerobaculia bacterium]